MAGTGAARHGIPIKDAESLEVAHAVTSVAFDKTGTLTSGRPQIIHLGGDDQGAASGSPAPCNAAASTRWPRPCRARPSATWRFRR
ncbi:hypothetical protein P4123_26360 [Pseudomonas aeruginosa]|nr:hypothetical protein [Pseudomonas aeruginosa]